MDVDFNGLPDNVTSIFRGWVPAALLNVKHDARENYVKKTCFKLAKKLKLHTGLILSLNRMLISVAYQTAPQPVKSVEYQLRY